MPKVSGLVLITDFRMRDIMYYYYLFEMEYAVSGVKGFEERITYLCRGGNTMYQFFL